MIYCKIQNPQRNWMAAPQTGNPPNNNIAFYYQRKNALINGSPPAVRSSIEAVFDGRIRERVAQVVPQHQQVLVPASLLTLQNTQTVFNLIIPQDPQWANIFLTQSPALVGGTVNRVLDTPNLQALLEDWDAKDSIVTIVMGAAGPWLALQGLAVVGFTAAGVAAESLAAAWQAAIGIVASGSLFAWLQSMGASEALTGGLMLVAIAAGSTPYGIYKWATKPTPEKRLVAFLESLLKDREKRNKFWGTIGV